MKWNRAGWSGRRLFEGICVAVATLVIAGCTTNPFSLSASAVRDHRTAWEAAGVVDYEYEVHRQCECSPDWTRPARVLVLGGRVEEARYSDSGNPAASPGYYPTIDDLFDLIEEAIRLEAPGLRVSYDALLHYPTSISVDYDLQTVDDEISITARDLVLR